MKWFQSYWLSPLKGAVLFYVLFLTTSAWALDEKRQEELTYLVRQDCGSCHGMTLKGGLGGPLLPENVKEADTQILASIILNGVPGKPMPPWKNLLSEKEALWIAGKLKEGFPE